MFNYSKFLSCDFKEAQVTDCKFEGCNLMGTILPDGTCYNTQQEQEDHLNTLMRKQVQII